MNLHDLTTIIRNADPNISITRSSAIVEAIFDGMAAALERGEDVRIAGFGNFAVAEHPAREGRNPRTGESIAIAAKKAPKFKPAKALKDALNPPPQRKVGAARNSPMRRAG